MRIPVQQLWLLVTFLLLVKMNNNNGTCEQTIQASVLPCDIYGLTDETVNDGVIYTKCSNHYISKIIIRNSTLETMPRIFVHYLNLKIVNFTDCSITEFPNEAFKGAKNLLEFHFNGQNVKRLKEYQFMGAEALKILNLANSNFEELDLNSFETLTNVEILDLDHNRIHSLPLGIFDSLKSLKGIWLRNNQIQRINNHLFHHNHNLKLIYLDTNNLTRLEPDAFIGTVLQYLLINNNPLLEEVSLQPDTLTELMLIDASSTKLKRLTVPVSATEVYASNSSVAYVERGPYYRRINPHYRVNRMEFCRCKLTSLNQFIQFSSLEFLDVSQNEITDLDIKILSVLTNLKELNVAFNPITVKKFNFGSLLQISSLKLLKISGGQLDGDKITVTELSRNRIRLSILGPEEKTLTISGPVQATRIFDVIALQESYPVSAREFMHYEDKRVKNLIMQLDRISVELENIERVQLYSKWDIILNLVITVCSGLAIAVMLMLLLSINMDNIDRLTYVVLIME